jgi:hypothetical protein
MVVSSLFHGLFDGLMDVVLILSLRGLPTVSARRSAAQERHGQTVKFIFRIPRHEMLAVIDDVQVGLGA